MIEIKKSPTADSRTCDWSAVSKQELLESSKKHITDVFNGLTFFIGELHKASQIHDFDKISGIDWFHANFKTGFKELDWLDNHYLVNRHHIDKPNGAREDINLVDVLEHIVDCVMAGLARSGDVYPIKLPDELLQKALSNTVELLKNNIKVVSNV